jgi:hypothetical protein
MTPKERSEFPPLDAARIIQRAAQRAALRKAFRRLGRALLGLAVLPAILVINRLVGALKRLKGTQNGQ